jgi:hypothetical protein
MVYNVSSKSRFWDKIYLQIRGGKKKFLSGNMGRKLEIFCKICNVTITKITKQLNA